MIIYHITSRADWEQAQAAGQYSAPSLHTEGFIHTSKHEQVADTANRYYPGQHGLLLLCIDTDRLTAELRYDPVLRYGAPVEFPHIYGPLNLDAVVEVRPFEPDESGRFHL